MKNATGMIMVYTTFANESDARTLGRALVEEGLAACVNIIPGMTSIYRWEDAVETSAEIVMIVKSRAELESILLDTMARRHPYSVPALIVLSPEKVSLPYLEWLSGTTRASLE